MPTTFMSPVASAAPMAVPGSRGREDGVVVAPPPAVGSSPYDSKIGA